VVAIVLYTGPNYMLYNAALRQDPDDPIFQALKGNLYPNTIHAMVRMIRIGNCSVVRG